MTGTATTARKIATDFQVGEIVNAVYWRRGQQLPRRRALIVQVNPDSDVLLVWYYGTGSIEAGEGFQFITPREADKIGEGGRNYAGASRTQLRMWARQLNRSGNPDAQALRRKIVRLHNDITAALGQH